MKTLNLTTLRNDIYNLFNETVNEGEVLEIILKGGKKAFVICGEDYNQLTDAYNKIYYEKLNESMKEFKTGETVHLTLEELKDQLDELKEE